jgi:hypothetical protein
MSCAIAGPALEALGRLLVGAFLVDLKPQRREEIECSLSVQRDQ